MRNRPQSAASVQGRLRRHLWRCVWTVLHDVVAHPICGVLWILGAKKMRDRRTALERAGDWLHEATLPPMGWNDLEFVEEREALAANESPAKESTVAL